MMVEHFFLLSQGTANSTSPELNALSYNDSLSQVSASIIMAPLAERTRKGNCSEWRKK
jgi:hypothetical protein